MVIKSTVIIEILCKEMYFACGVVQAELMRINILPTLTSGQDSHENKPLSLHHSGKAADFRVKTIPLVSRVDIINKIKKLLNPLGFDVVHEDINGKNEHLHIEWQPKGTESIFIRET